MDVSYSLNTSKMEKYHRNNRISENILFLNHHLIKCNILLSLEKLNSKELYLIQLTRVLCRPTSKIYFEKHLTTAYLIGSIFMFFHAL